MLCISRLANTHWCGTVNMSTSKQPKRRLSARITVTMVGARIKPDLLDAVDLWEKAQSGLPTRLEAVRRLVELGMQGKDSSRGDSNPPALNSAWTGT